MFFVICCYFFIVESYSFFTSINYVSKKHFINSSSYIRIFFCFILFSYFLVFFCTGNKVWLVVQFLELPRPTLTVIVFWAIWNFPPSKRLQASTGLLNLSTKIKPSKGGKWYFVSKIVLTYCEKKLFQWLNLQNFWEHYSLNQNE